MNKNLLRAVISVAAMMAVATASTVQAQRQQTPPLIQEPSTAPNDLGARLFRTHCATCHGASARGDGPLAGQLRRVPPDLTKYTARNGGVFPSERVNRIIDGRDVASHGDRTMPVWGDAFRSARDGLTAESVKARIDAIVKYLQGIQERAAE